MDGDQADVGRWIAGLHPRLVEPYGFCYELTLLGNHFTEDSRIRQGMLCNNNHSQCWEDQ